MAATVGQVPRRAGEQPKAGRTTPTAVVVREVLLALGIVGPLFYAATDIFVGTRWEGYSYADQVVSELFAIDAPTRPLAVPLFVAYGVLAIAFGVGVWGSAGRKRALRVVAGGLVGKELFGIVATVFAPMHMRGGSSSAPRPRGRSSPGRWKGTRWSAWSSMPDCKAAPGAAGGDDTLPRSARPAATSPSARRD